MTKQFLVNSNSSLSNVVIFMRETLATKKPMRVNVLVGRDRSAEQNAISHAWYRQIAMERGEMTATEVKNFCKLHFGVPLRRGECPRFSAFYGKVMQGLPYEEKLEYIEHVPVTSDMGVKTMTTYLENVQAHYASQQVDPVLLEWPEE